MVRLIRRYESRKLYDTEESRYVGLEEISAWVREGQEVRVIDVASEGDVTAQTLTQIILEDGKRGAALPADLLHDLIRMGERAVASGVEQVRQRVDRILQRSIDHLAPVQRAREEMADLKTRLAELEESLARIAQSGARRAVSAPAGSARKANPRPGRKARRKRERT
jgi:polyhydroxyalkanoate synthesis repressor PhaR